MADIGSDNFEQEFTLSLMENDGGTLDADRGFVGANRRGDLRPVRGVRNEDSEEPVERDSLRYIVRSLRRTAGTTVLKQAVPLNRYVAFFALAIGVCLADLGAKTWMFGSPPFAGEPALVALAGRPWAFKPT